MAYWLYPELQKRERKPLTACKYAYIQKQFPPSDNNDNYQMAVFRVIIVNPLQLSLQISYYISYFHYHWFVIFCRSSIFLY